MRKKTRKTNSLTHIALPHRPSTLLQRNWESFLKEDFVSSLERTVLDTFPSIVWRIYHGTRAATAFLPEVQEVSIWRSLKGQEQKPGYSEDVFSRLKSHHLGLPAMHLPGSLTANQPKKKKFHNWVLKAFHLALDVKEGFYSWNGPLLPALQTQTVFIKYIWLLLLDWNDAGEVGWFLLFCFLRLISQ